MKNVNYVDVELDEFRPELFEFTRRMLFEDIDSQCRLYAIACDDEDESEYLNSVMEVFKKKYGNYMAGQMTDMIIDCVKIVESMELND